MCGRTYHYLPRSNRTGGLHHFIVDKYSEALSHAESLNSSTNENMDRSIKDSILNILWNELHKHNPFVQSCQILGKAISIINCQNPEEQYLPAAEVFCPEVIAQINSISAPHLLDVASVTDESVTGNRVVRFKLKGQNSWNTLPVTHHHLEPLTYPLLFLEGEDGWGSNISKSVHFPDYIANRMLMPEEGIFVRNSENTKWVPANRFQIFARIAQYWLCDSVSRNIDCRLNWIKNNQNYISGIPDRGGERGFGGEADIHCRDDLPMETNRTQYTNDEPDDWTKNAYENESPDHTQQFRHELTPDQPGYRESSQKTFLGSKFHGSMRHLRTLSENGLIIVSEKGEPHLFITLTTNTEWPEIKEHLSLVKLHLIGE